MPLRSFRSPPAQNAREPAPVSTMQRCSCGAPAIVWNSSSRSRPICVFIALATSGRVSVISRVLGCGSDVCNVAYVFGMAAFQSVGRKSARAKPGGPVALPSTQDARLRGAVRLVALLNLGFFGIEFAVAVAIGSVSLFADSIDFLEDASVNLLIAIALNWPPRSRARLGMALSGILLIPGIAALWTAWTKLNDLSVPAPIPLSATGLGALAVNLTCAFILAHYRYL